MTLTVANPETVWLTPCGDTTGGFDLDMMRSLNLPDQNVHRFNIWIIANVVSGDDVRTWWYRSRRDGDVAWSRRWCHKAIREL